MAAKKQKQKLMKTTIYVDPGLKHAMKAFLRGREGLNMTHIFHEGAVMWLRTQHARVSMSAAEYERRLRSAARVFTDMGE